MMRPLLIAMSIVVAASFWPRSAQADSALKITRTQFQLYRDYQAALTDARVEKMKPAKRLPAIARNFHVKLAELKTAIALGDAEAGQVQQSELAAIKAAFAGTPLEGKLGQVRVDASQGRVIAYVEWFNADPAKLNQEACWVAARTTKAAPLVGTIDLYAQDAAAKTTRVYSALIDADRAANIHEDQIVDFAATRYSRLFEKHAVSAAP